jgi:hypothetical protein
VDYDLIVACLVTKSSDDLLTGEVKFFQKDYTCKLFASSNICIFGINYFNQYQTLFFERMTLLCYVFLTKMGGKLLECY